MGTLLSGAPRHGLGRHRPDAESGVSDAAGRIDAWLAELAGQRRQSAHTIAAYRRDLALLIELAGLPATWPSRRSAASHPAFRRPAACARLVRPLAGAHAVRVARLLSLAGPARRGPRIGRRRAAAEESQGPISRARCRRTRQTPCSSRPATTCSICATRPSSNSSIPPACVSELDASM